MPLYDPRLHRRLYTVAEDFYRKPQASIPEACGGVTTSKDFPTKKAYQRTYAGDPGFGSAPNGGQFPVGWGNGDCWLAKFQPVPATSETRIATPQTPRPASAK